MTAWQPFGMNLHCDRGCQHLLTQLLLSQGLGLLLVCTSAQQRTAAVQGLRTHVPAPCTDCLLLIQVQWSAPSGCTVPSILYQAGSLHTTCPADTSYQGYSGKLDS